MAVRFLPPPDEESRSEDRGDLAEVIELRSQLNRPRVRGAVGFGDRTEEGDGADEVDEVDAVDQPEGEAGSAARQATREELARLIDSGVASMIETGVRPVVQGDFAARVSPASGPLEGGADTGAPDKQEIDDPESDPADEAPGRTAHEDGVRILGRRARSSGELREELARLDHGADEIETVVDEFTRSLYLDDLGLARTLTEKLRHTKRASRSQIRVKLQARRLPGDVIETAIGELDSDEEFELLRQTARDRAAKLGGLERQVAERRLLGFLARRGWSGEPAMRAARDALDGATRGSRGGRGGSGVRFE